MSAWIRSRNLDDSLTCTDALKGDSQTGHSSRSREPHRKVGACDFGTQSIIIWRAGFALQNRQRSNKAMITEAELQRQNERLELLLNQRPESRPASTCARSCVRLRRTYAKSYTLMP